MSGAAILACGAAAAAEARAAALDEVVVTARKQAEDVRDVPLSITVVQGAKLADVGVNDLENLTGRVPNFSVNSTPIGDTISIRGVNSAGQSGAEQDVGAFVDGVFRGRGVQSRFSFLDIGAVEVVRGPQGTLFGKNTIAGALNITSARPTRTPAASVAYTHEFENDENEIRAFVSGPLSERVRVRLAGLWDELDEGWVTNAFYKETLPRWRNWALRGSVEADVTETLDVYAKYEHGAFHDRGQPFVALKLYQGPPPAIGALGLFVNNAIKAAGVTEGLGDRTIIGNSGPLDLGTAYRMDGHTDEALARFDWRVGPGTLTGLVAHSSYDFERDLDADNDPLSIINILEHERYEQQSAELRYVSRQVGPFKWLGGAYWQRSILKYGDPHTGNFANFAAIGVAVPITHRLDIFKQDERTVSAFGQLTYELSPTIRLTGGARYNDEHKRAVQVVDLLDLGGAPLVGATLATMRVLLETFPHSIAPARSEQSWTWSANAQWDASDDAKLYATVSTGGKGGGFNVFYFATGGPRVGETAAQFQARMTNEAQFRPETAISYEVGAKLRIGPAAELNAAAFYSRYHDLQESQFTGATTFVVGNAASARVQGVELDGRWRPASELTLYGNLAWLDFKFTSYRNAGCTVFQALAFGGSVVNCAAAGGNDLSGRTNQNSPEWTGMVGGEWRHPLADGRQVRGSLETSFVSRFYAMGSLDPNSIQSAYAKLDAVLAYGAGNGRWELALVGRNLTNERTFWDANNLPLATGSYRATEQRPRTIAVRAAFSY